MVKRAGYDTITEVIKKKIPNPDKFITANEFNKLTKEHFAGRLKQAKLATKDYISD